MKFPVAEAAGIIAGSIAAGFVTKLVNDKLPNVPNVVKSIIPIGAGLFLAGQKNTIVKNAGLGMIAKGGADLARAFVPGIGASIDDLISSPADQSILSLVLPEDTISDPADASILSGDDLLMSPEEIAAADDFAVNGDPMGAEEATLMGSEVEF